MDQNKKTTLQLKKNTLHIHATFLGRPSLQFNPAATQITQLIVENRIGFSYPVNYCFGKMVLISKPGRGVGFSANSSVTVRNRPHCLHRIPLFLSAPVTAAPAALLSLISSAMIRSNEKYQSAISFFSTWGYFGQKRVQRTSRILHNSHPFIFILFHIWLFPCTYLYWSGVLEVLKGFISLNYYLSLTE